MSAKFRKFLIAIFLGTVTTSTLGCQGSNLGGSLENAIAPVTPPPEKASLDQPTKPTTEPSSETIAKNPLIVLPSSSNVSSLKTSLQEIFAIEFDFKNATALSKDLTKEFSDLDQAPAPLREWIKDLYQLGTIAPKTGQEFRPNILVSRREYARWLLETNNRLYASQPSRQIRLAQSNDALSFPDIPNNHPDFAIIQGLANAGLIGGTGDRFLPDDPLSREEMVLWKIPLDLRQPLPNATADSIRQSWGFRDSDRISKTALSAIFADSQLGDLSNIRRSFGFTTLLQPQKPITRAEAAASLWYFGTAADGLSARKVLDLGTPKQQVRE